MSDQETQTNNTAAGVEAAAQNADNAAAGTDAQNENATDNNEDANAGGLGDGVDPAADDNADKDKKDDKDGGEDADKKDKDDKDGKENEYFGKPEAYDYKDVKLPENMQLDEAMTGKFNEYATKLNLSQKGANDFMAMAVELTQQTQQQTVEAMGKLQEAKVESYKQLLNSDKEVGGANFKQSIATANLAYDGFFQDQELRNILAEGGLNVHPKFIKALKAIGSQMKEDTIHSQGGAANESKEREDILYPSMDKN